MAGYNGALLFGGEILRIHINMRQTAIELTEYIFVLLLILECNSVWSATVDSNLYKIVRVALIIVALLYLLVNKSISRSKMNSIGVAVIIAAAYCLVYAVIVRYNIVNFCYIAIIAAAIYIFVSVAVDKNRGAQLLIKYKDLIVIIAVISLFFWLFGSQLGLISPTGTIISTWTSTSGTTKQVSSYYGIYFESQSTSSFLNLISQTTCRNTAIFTEAPMCNFHMCIALIIELFYCKKVSKVKCTILVLTILTTFSTTGYCMMIIAFVAKYIFSKGINRFSSILKVAIIPVILVVGIILLQILFLDKMDTGSGVSRASDFATGFQAWLEQPLFGYGYGASTYYHSVHYGYSNSITPILGYGGIFLAIPYLYFMIKWVYRCVKERDMQKFLLFANFMFLFLITIVSFRFLTMFFLFASCIPREKTAAEEGVTVRSENGSNVRNKKIYTGKYGGAGG